ncbi:hypothetical protein L596_017254 [Steinernema carpocapsae]|uniref:Copper transport protein ATOX1 n=1 Tax=Steinernema carpocapsae TaxID=34508 RepID=A0A4U5N1T4_STECR|nr:hypothetical protein L596_017254 [Steinernema carpocapsae]
MAQTFVFEMEMTCEGCANAAKKCLGKLGDKVSKIETDVATKRVIVTTDLTKEEVLEQLKKTGKACRPVDA